MLHYTEHSIKGWSVRRTNKRRASNQSRALRVMQPIITFLPTMFRIKLHLT